MKGHFFKPLCMTRSTLEQNPDSPNVAEPYLWSGDADSPLQVVKPPFASGEIMAGAMSAKSTINDLLKFYENFMQALEDQTVNDTTSTPGSPFKLASKLIEPQVSLSGSPSDISKGSYASGWVTVPAPMSHVTTPNAVERRFASWKGVFQQSRDTLSLWKSRRIPGLVHSHS